MPKVLVASGSSILLARHNSSLPTMVYGSTRHRTVPTLVDANQRIGCATGDVPRGNCEHIFCDPNHLRIVIHDHFPQVDGTFLGPTRESKDPNIFFLID